MKLKGFCIVIFCVLLSTKNFGQLLQWNTFGNLGTETSEPSVFNDPNISATNLTQGTITAASNGNRFGGSNWFNTGNTAVGNTLAEAITGNDYIQFIVTPNAGCSYTPTSFVFQWDKSGTGPKNLALRSSADGYAADLGALAPVAALGTSNTITISGLTATTTATTFRLYGYGATATGGTGGFDVSTNIVNVQLNGTSASSTPTLILTPPTFSGFTYAVGAGPSASQSYNLSGSNLTGAPGNIAITSSTDYEVSTDNITFFGSTTVAYASATLATTPIYVRLKAGLSAGNYNAELISNAGGGATTLNVSCSGTVTAATASATSDIITAGGESATISSLINDATLLSSTAGVQVWQFKVRDGGASLSDADNLPTILSSFILSQAAGNAVSNWLTAIKTIELFDGITNVGVGSVSTSPNQISFTGLSLSVPDNTEKTYSLRLSLNCGIGASNNDGDDFGFQISNGNVTFSPSGSGKFAFPATITTNGWNIISVVATQLSFIQQPVSAGQNQLMVPTVAIKATDICGNTDLGFIGTVSITSTGTLTGAPVSTSAIAGIATYSGLTHTVIGTGYTLTASAPGLLSVVSTLFDITNVTVFGVGDIAIVGMCVNMNGCAGSTAVSEDEISFVSFEDITPGTTIDITDNGFERKICGSNTWGNTEGVVRITRNTSTVAKGTIITLRILDEAIFFPLQPDANWTVSYPNTGYGTFNMNSGDEQIYILQGGAWNKNTSGAHDATYVGGTLMFAINTYTAWTCNANSTQRGELPLGLKCFSILPGIASDNIKYSGPVTPASQKDWIDRLNSASNWTGSNSCAAYISTGLDYSAPQTFSIISSGFSSGYWTGAANTDWYDCNNWQNYKVPDSLANVTIDNVANDPIIAASPVLYPNGAICNDLAITSTSGAGFLTLNNSLSHLSIKGNITNNGFITASNGLTDLRSAIAQTISGTGTSTFYNLRLNNTNALGVSLSQDVTSTNTLTFTNGVLSTGSNRFIITNTVVPTISGFNATKFINGILRHYIGSNTSVYTFPIGDGIGSTNYKRVDIVNNNLSGISYIDASVNSVIEISPEDDATFIAAAQTQSGTTLTSVMENAQWDLTPDSPPSGGNYGVRLYTANTGLSAADDDTFCPVKRPSSSLSYADWLSLEGSTTIPAIGAAGRIYNAGAGYAERLGYTSFSKHAIAKGTIVLPIELLSFTAKYISSHQVDINWSTASELNNDYFTIERSKDAISFDEINITDGAGNSTSPLFYSTTDDSPMSGTSYYRLKQTDFNGDFKYSNTVSVQNNESNFDIVSAHYLQSPNQYAIYFNCNSDCSVALELYDIRGQKVYSSFENTLGTNSEVLIPTKDLSEGIYLIKVFNGNKLISRKIKL